MKPAARRTSTKPSRPARGTKPATAAAPRKKTAGPRRANGHDAQEGVAFVDGKLMPLREARIPLLDRGFLLGDGIFETLRVSNGRIFRLDDHLDRFQDGLAAVGLGDGLAEEAREAAQRLVAAGRSRHGDELYLRLMATTGPMEALDGGDRGVMLCGFVRAFKPYPMQYYARGIQLVVSRQRKDSANPLCGVKTLSFLPHVAARREAHNATAHDAVLLNEHGRVAEATTSNVFALRKGVLHAPGRTEGALPGVTRKVLLELVEDAGLDLVEPLSVRDLAGAEEAFITNTTGGVVPVTMFQEKPIGRGAGKGRKGELTTRLSHAFEDLVRTHG